MSDLPSSSAGNSMPEQEPFNIFFEHWIIEQNQHLDNLISSVKEHSGHGHGHGDSSSPSSKGSDLGRVVDRVMEHYEHYYKAKSRCSKVDVLTMLSPSWISSLENAFLWIGGWRPSMAFHLLYSESGLRLEAQLSELLRGISVDELGDLSPAQLSRVDELQMRTIKEEKKITEKMAKHQETVADGGMVELSHAVSEMMRTAGAADRTQTAEEEEKVESALKSKEEKLTELLGRADDLRLRTLRGVVDILTPIQAAHFLIAAAELHLRVHEWGKKRDAREERGTQDSSTD